MVRKSDIDFYLLKRVNEHRPIPRGRDVRRKLTSPDEDRERLIRWAQRWMARLVGAAVPIMVAVAILSIALLATFLWLTFN